MIDQSMITTSIELNGYRVVKNMGCRKGHYRSVKKPFWKYSRGISNLVRRNNFDLCRTL